MFLSETLAAFYFTVFRKIAGKSKTFLSSKMEKIQKLNRSSIMFSIHAFCFKIDSLTSMMKVGEMVVYFRVKRISLYNSSSIGGEERRLIIHEIGCI